MHVIQCFEENNDKHTITRNTAGHWKSCIARATYSLVNYLQTGNWLTGGNCNYILQTLVAALPRVFLAEIYESKNGFVFLC